MRNLATAIGSRFALWALNAPQKAGRAVLLTFVLVIFLASTVSYLLVE